MDHWEAIQITGRFRTVITGRYRRLQKRRVLLRLAFFSHRPRVTERKEDHEALERSGQGRLGSAGRAFAENIDRDRFSVVESLVQFKAQVDASFRLGLSFESFGQR